MKVTGSRRGRGHGGSRWLVALLLTFLAAFELGKIFERVATSLEVKESQTNWGPKKQPMTKDLAQPSQPSSSSVNLPKKVNSGWDDRGQKIYSDRVAQISTLGTLNVTFSSFANNHGPFMVSKDNGGNTDFWERATAGKWEWGTFDIFNKFVTGSTTVIDFGTWIGPTMLFHGQFSKQSFGIEADPAAFAIVEYNVELNRKHNPSWGLHVSVDSGCIVRPEDVGKLTMKAGGDPGMSMSGIGKKVFMDKGKRAVKWEVQCYTLPDIFENYWGIQKPYKDVFIKIDIETYECKLVPSFYDWLKGEKYLPTMYISFHPQIQKCTEEEYKTLLMFIGLYDNVVLSGRVGEKSNHPSDEFVTANIQKTHSIIVYQESGNEISDQR